MAIPLRGDFDASGLRAAARRSKDAAQARRMLACEPSSASLPVSAETAMWPVSASVDLGAGIGLMAWLG